MPQLPPRAYAAEGSLAYDPIVEWLRSEVLQKRMQRLDDIWLLEVARLVPEVRTQYCHLPITQPLTEGWQRRHFFEALARAFLSAAEPLVLVLEDLQWCDRETLDWLALPIALRSTQPATGGWYSAHGRDRP